MIGIRKKWGKSMISMEQISGEIAALEEEKPTHTLMQKLANLYTVRDHMVIDSEPAVSPTTVEIRETIPDIMSDSKFMQTIVGRNVKSVISVIDELMETLRIINPKLYESVLRQLND